MGGTSRLSLPPDIVDDFLPTAWHGVLSAGTFEKDALGENSQEGVRSVSSQEHIRVTGNRAAHER